MLKGANSVVADESGSVWQLGQTAAWVARAGLGDLLAGYAAGVGCMGMAVKNSCQGDLLATAMFIHAEASRTAQKGSTATAINKTLGSLTNQIQQVLY